MALRFSVLRVETEYSAHNVESNIANDDYRSKNAGQIAQLFISYTALIRSIVKILFLQFQFVIRSFYIHIS